jgi:superfamily I DNA/RNA helicase
MRRKPAIQQVPLFGAMANGPSPFSLDEEITRRFPGFVPSSYQRDIFAFVREGHGDGIVNAVAGSGKSTTLLHAARLLTEPVLLVAFNSHIAEELRGKIRADERQRLTARTLHSIGQGCIARWRKLLPTIDPRKYKRLCWLEVPQRVVPQAGQLQRKAVEQLLELVNYARLTLADAYDTEALDLLIEHFGLDIEPEVYEPLLEAVPSILLQGMHQAEKQGVIDFTDQIWLPEVLQLQPAQVPFVFVDEAQDLNAAQLALALKCRAPGGRMLFVGDVHQAIYGFSGADSEALQRIRDKTHATDLPLSICYRCPTRHVALAKEIVPQIEASPNAKPGVTGEVRLVAVPGAVQAGDLVLCRKMAPLVDLCITLIEQQVPAKVRGRDLSYILTEIVEDVTEMPGYTDYIEFGRFLVEYEQAIVAKLSHADDNEDRIQQIQDRCRAVAACYRAFHVTTAKQLCAKIEDLFSDDRVAVYLSTVHRAKGLEADRVFILEPDNLPLVWEKQQEWEYQQEMNLKYVALTRAKVALFFIID